MIVSLAIYHISLFLSTFFSLNKHKKGSDNNLFSNIFNNYGFIVVFFIVVILNGFRVDVGTDYQHYELINRMVSQGVPTLMEPGFIYLNKIVLDLGFDVRLVFLIMTILTYSLLFKVLLREKIFGLGIFFVFTFGFIFISNNIIRQAFTIAIFFYSIKYIYSRELLKFCLVLFIGFLFHKTIILMLPFYFVSRVSFHKIFWVVMILISTLLSFTDFIPYILNNVVARLPKYSGYLNQNFGSAINSGLTNLLYAAMYLYVVFFMDTFKSLKDRVYLNIFLVGINISFMFMTVDFLYRVSYYFVPMFILIIPMLHKNLKLKFNRHLTLSTFILLSLLLWYKAMILNDHGCMPYQNWLIG